MTLNVAIQMDPIGGINPHGDTTLVIGLEAQLRGHELYYYTPDKLVWLNGSITASGHRIRLHPNPDHYYDLGETVTVDLSAMDVVLLRQDPPFNMHYITTTHFLDMLPAHSRASGGGKRKGPLVFNNPASVRNHPEKIFPLMLRQYMPETLITADAKEIEAFYHHHKDIVIKPLYGFGGRAILRFKEGDDNFYAAMEMQFALSHEMVMVQRFLPEVKTGDRRIIFIDGKVCGVMGRIPAEHEIRANLRVGGTAAKAELTPKQKEVCDILGPMLKERGLLFAGVDMIGDYLTEINITSPTGMVQINKLYGIRLEAQFWDAIENHIQSR